MTFAEKLKLKTGDRVIAIVTGVNYRAGTCGTVYQVDEHSPTVVRDDGVDLGTVDLTRKWEVLVDCPSCGGTWSAPTLRKCERACLRLICRDCIEDHDCVSPKNRAHVRTGRRTALGPRRVVAK